MKLAHRAAVTLILVALAGLPGCGIKSAPVAPEDAQPMAIRDLRATVAADGIQLSWNRPVLYVSGHRMRDLGDFVILRAIDGASPEALIKVAVTDQERFAVQRQFTYLDGETTLGNHYTYTVIAETLDGYRSQPSNEVEITRTEPLPPPNPATFRLATPAPLPTNLP